ncbi:MAG: hypothetical protein Q4G65_11205 [bacterium]|nr:hypothetical protein [bacterium]
MTTGFEKANGTPLFRGRSVFGRWILAGVLGVTLATFGAAEELTEFVVTAETPLTIGATSAGDKEHNAKDKLIDLRAGATVTLGEPLDGGAYFWSTLVVTNGPSTLVLHDDTTSLGIDNNFIVRAPGSLTIKSAQCRTYVFQQGNGMGSTADSMVQNDFSGGVVFTDLSGAAVSVNAEIRAATTQLSRKPDGFSHVDGSTYYVAKPNLYPDATEIVYDANFKIRLALLDTNVFVRGQTVKLPTEWRTVILMPAQVPDYATEHDRAWTFQDGVFDFDVETGHVNAGLFFQSSKDVTFKGKMSGPGSITVKVPADKQSGTARVLGDIADFTGAVVVEEGQKLVFGSVLAHENKVNLGKNATLAFSSDVTDIPLSSVEGSEDVAHPAFLSVEAGQQVTIARISGSVRLRGGRRRLVCPV